MYFCKKSLMVIVILCYYKILQFNTIYYFRRDICLRFFLSFKPFLGNKVFSTTSLTKLPDLFGPIRRPSSVKCPSRNFAWHLSFVKKSMISPLQKFILVCQLLLNFQQNPKQQLADINMVGTKYSRIRWYRFYNWQKLQVTGVKNGKIITINTKNKLYKSKLCLKELFLQAIANFR